MKIIGLTWKEFIELAKNNPDCFYRGHSSSSWELLSTLGRFINRAEVQAAAYYKILHSILSDEKIKNNPNFASLYLSKGSPLLNGLMYGDDAHKESFQCTFDLMIELRHLGFPSPIIDLTKNPDVAAFFALSDTLATSKIAIYSFKITENFHIFGNTAYISEFNFHGGEATHKNLDPYYIHRHKRQESAYLIAINQTHKDTVIPREQRVGPYFLLPNLEEMSLNRIEITKFIITDSKNNRLKFLEELSAKSLSYEYIYGDTHILENSYLKDLAIKELLFSETLNTPSYPWQEYNKI